MCAILGLVEFELAAPADDLSAVGDVLLQRLLQREDFRLTVDQGEIDDAEGRFEVVFEQLVLDDVDVCPPLGLDDDPDAVARTVIRPRPVA